ncbi:MAG: N-methylhydantoinase B [Planctomycetota bacterium]|jgi:N-methylhydantoinase B
MRAKAQGKAPDRLRLEVFHHLFAALGEEMGVTLMRSSFSPNIKERRDFSCAMFDADGRMIAQAAHLPVHLGAAPMSVAAAREVFEMQSGDVVLLNDPYRGGTHLPDLTLISPVFLQGDKSPSFYLANRAHHADVGGQEPGSMAPARDVHGEGLRIPPVRLIKNGAMDQELLSLLLANMRVPGERKADLLAQWAANRIGETRMHEMALEYGARELRVRAAQLMDWTEELSSDLARSVPQGSWSFEDHLESPGPGGDGLARIALTLRKQRGRLIFDFSATDDQIAGALNTPPAVPRAAVFYCLQQLLPPGTPANDGVLRPVEIVTRPGSLVDARYPAPVAAGNVETSQRLVDVIQGVLAQVWPERIPAASAGTMSNLTFGGAGDENTRAFAYYETIAGGAGAGPLGPGAHALQTHMTNTRNTPIEALEAHLPVRILSYSVRRGSGGKGRFAGGDGLVRRLRFLREVRVGFVAERSHNGPWGLAGGASGQVGGARLRLTGARRDQQVPSKGSFQLSAGSEFEVRTPGGGGFGD